MADKRPSTKAADRTSREPSEAGSRARATANGPGLNEVDREIIGALTDFRDTLRARVPAGPGKYTVRQVGGVLPPPDLGPEDVRRTRAALGVSQPVFADFLGTSASTVRSWEQGQKPPSPMARRLLGLIAADPPYWRGRFFALIQGPGSGPGASGEAIPLSGGSGDRPGGHRRRRGRATVRKGGDEGAEPKVRT